MGHLCRLSLFPVYQSPVAAVTNTPEVASLNSMSQPSSDWCQGLEVTLEIEEQNALGESALEWVLPWHPVPLLFHDSSGFKTGTEKQ